MESSSSGINISISSDLSDESVGSSFLRVILIGSISVEVPVAPEVGAAAVTLPVGVLELDTHSSLKIDPSNSSLPPVYVAHMVSPFLCSDNSETDMEMLERHVSPTPHDDMLTRWRSRVASRTSSPTNSTLEIPTAPIPLAPSTVVAPFTDIISPGFDSEEIGYSSSDHSSSGHSISGHSLSEHSPPVTTIADSSAPSRFIYQPLSRTLRYSEAYRHWRSALLSTMYPLMTSESSVGDSSSKLSVGPSRKRCRSPTTTVTLYIHALRALVPSRADLLPPRKRFRDFISPEDSVEDDIDTDVLADIEADATAIGVTGDMDVEDEVKGEVESSDRGTMDVGVDVVVGIDIPDEDIKTGQKDLEARSLIVGGERVSLLDQVASLERSNARLRGTLMMESARADSLTVASGKQTCDCLACKAGVFKRWSFGQVLQETGAWLAYEANHAAELAVESQSQNGDDDDNGNVEGNGNRNGGGNGDGNGGGNGNGNRGGNRNRNPNRNDKGCYACCVGCTCHDFVKCQPLNFKGTKGVVGLTRWFEKMERVFHIKQLSRERTVGGDAAFAMTWRELIKLMTEVEKFNGGIPDNIQGNVIAEPTRQQDVVRIANNLMDQKLKGYVVKNVENKRRSYTAGNNEKRGYAGPLPYYNKSKLHHEGPCTVKCEKCKKRVPTCFECGRHGHYRNVCPKLKDQTRGNKAGKKIDEARGKAYVLGGG
ncbi:reverse transcriptase domain-containing protein [Tanacetum coccineum]